MPWNECKPMDERLRFIARLLEGETMASEMLMRGHDASASAGIVFFSVRYM